MAENNANNKSILGSDTKIEVQETTEKQQQEQQIDTSDETDVDVQDEIDDTTTDRRIKGKAPLIVFIGPSGCGKSMVLMSLVEYLRGMPNYTIKVDKAYLKTKRYKGDCDRFEKILRLNANKESSEQRDALPGTVREFMVNILKGNILKYRMLEVPGEHFFSYDKNTTKAKKTMAPYLKNVILNKSRMDEYPIYFVMLLDLHTNKEEFLGSTTKRCAYEERLIEIYENGFNKKRGDRIVLLYNKFDERNTEDYGKEEEIKYLENLLKNYYSKIKRKLSRDVFGLVQTPIYKILPYISGENFMEINEEETKYNSTQISENCAKRLWDCLTQKKWQIWL